jgi:hypothetical protein
MSEAVTPSPDSIEVGENDDCGARTGGASVADEDVEGEPEANEVSRLLPLENELCDEALPSSW